MTDSYKSDEISYNYISFTGDEQCWKNKGH